MRTVIAVLSLSLACFAARSETLALGQPTRTKHAAFDTATNKLYIAHNTGVTIVDVASLTIAGRVAGLSVVRAVAIALNGHGYATSSRDRTVTVSDTKSSAVSTTLSAEKDADTIVYDPASRRVFAMNDDDGTITVIDYRAPEHPDKTTPFIIDPKSPTE